MYTTIQLRKEIYGEIKTSERETNMEIIIYTYS